MTTRRRSLLARLVRPAVPDDRGHPRVLLRIDAFPIWQDHVSPIDLDLRQRIAHRLNVDGPARGFWPVLLRDLLVLGVAAGFLLAFMHIGSRLFGWSLWLGPIALGLVTPMIPMTTAIVGHRWLVFNYRREFIDAFVGEGRCPACGYPVGEVPIEPDGRLVCPECGGAWRVPGGGAADTVNPDPLPG